MKTWVQVASGLLDNFKQPNGLFTKAGQYWGSQHDASSFRSTPRQRLLVKSGASCLRRV